MEVLYNVKKGEFDMDITRIGNEAMKISLCTREAMELGFGEEQSEENMKNSFKRLLVKAKEEIEYAVLAEKIYGEIFTGKDGGCEIFVSRVEARDRVYKDKIFQETSKRTKPSTSVFVFDSIDMVLNAAKRLRDIAYEGLSPVYHDSVKGRYYIMLDDVSTKDLKYAFLSEYSCQVKGGLNAMYIKEHFKCVCKKDGVKILSRC